MYEITTCTQDISVQEVKTMNKSTNKFVVPGAKQAIDRMKYEIASELGVNLGPDATSRANGSVGGEITKRLVQMGEQHLGGSNYQAK
jgi:hypothetical protein